VTGPEIGRQEVRHSWDCAVIEGDVLRIVDVTVPDYLPSRVVLEWTADELRITLMVSVPGPGIAVRAMEVTHCCRVTLSQPVGNRRVVDGANGETLAEKAQRLDTLEYFQREAIEVALQRCKPIPAMERVAGEMRLVPPMASRHLAHRR
jgi:hypothetical protein